MKPAEPFTPGLTLSNNGQKGLGMASSKAATDLTEAIFSYISNKIESRVGGEGAWEEQDHEEPRMGLSLTRGVPTSLVQGVPNPIPTHRVTQGSH